MEADDPAVFIVGAGQYAPDTMTLEGARLLRAARKVFSFSDVAGLDEILASSDAVHVVLDSFVKYGAPRRNSYASAVAPVLEAAMCRPPVAWVCNGNPGYIDGGSAMIIEKAAELGLRTAIVPGVSAIDTVLCECNMRMPASSLQVYSASQLLLLDVSPIPALPTLVFQVARAETQLEIGAAPVRRRGLERLSARLTRSYRPKHSAFLVTSRHERHGATRVRTLRLDELPDLHGDVDPWTSLFVPPDLSRHILDSEVQAQLVSYEHMEQCYLTPMEMLAMRLAQESTPKN